MPKAPKKIVVKPKGYDENPDFKPKPKVKVVDGFREVKSSGGMGYGAGYTKKGVWTYKDGSKIKRNYPAPNVFSGEGDNFKMNPGAYSELSPASKGDRMLAKLAALKSVKAKKGK